MVDPRRRAADAYQKQATSPPDSADAAGSDDPDRQTDGGVKRRPHFLKTGISPDQLLAGGGVERAAKLLILLGTERAAPILAQLDEADTERIAAYIMQTPRVRTSESDALLEKIGEAPPAPPRAGGPEVAREMLVRALGEEAGERVFFRSVPNAAARHFQFLDGVEPHQMVVLLKEESPPAIAVILAHIQPAVAGKVLEALGPERARDVVRRIGRMQRLDRDVVLRIEEALRAKIRRQGRQITQAVEGASTLAAILRAMPASDERALLEAIDVTDPQLSTTVKDQLYTEEIIYRLDDRGLQELLRDFDEAEIALVMKGKDEAFRSAILRNVSERRRELISDEYQRLGPQRRSDVDEATRDFVLHIRRAEQAGRVLVRWDDDHYT